MNKSYTSKILQEIKHVLSKVNQKELNSLANTILNSNKIVTLGAGRVGLVCRAFSMRLAHLGLHAFNLQDSVVPSLKPGDLLFVCSGSGETQTIYDLVAIAKSNQITVSLITGNPSSRIGNLSDIIVNLKSPSKTKKIPGFESIQPMTTLNEQCLFVLCDAIVLMLMDKLGETHETMWQRHSILE